MPSLGSSPTHWPVVAWIRLRLPPAPPVIMLTPGPPPLPDPPLDILEHEPVVTDPRKRIFAYEEESEGGVVRLVWDAEDPAFLEAEFRMPFYGGGFPPTGSGRSGARSSDGPRGSAPWRSTARTRPRSGRNRSAFTSDRLPLMCSAPPSCTCRVSAPLRSPSCGLRGVRDWADLREASGGVRRSLAWKGRRFERELAESERALAERRVEWFARRLPGSEAWRLYPVFRPETAFLDIETTGLSRTRGSSRSSPSTAAGRRARSSPTTTSRSYPAYLRRFGVLVTFNGRRFDVPFLEFRFPDLVAPPAHIDLRYLLYRIGYAGGLKRIEQTLGLGDRPGVEGIHGLDAVRLWEEYPGGRTDSLERLVRYNRADTVNLEPLLDFATRELRRRLLPDVPRRPL